MRSRALRGMSIAVVLGCAGCGSSSSSPLDDSSNTSSNPKELNGTDYTYTLTEGTAQLPLFTTPATHRLSVDDRAPGSKKSGLYLSAAKREFEPVQLVLGPGSGSVSVRVRPFESLGAGQRITVARASFVEGLAETLEPLADGGTVPMDAATGTAVWITVFVPADAGAGDHETTVELTREGDTPVVVPLRLHVFNFALPEETHFSSQINLGISDLVPSGGTVDDAKSMLFEHRLTPSSVTWPSGFDWQVTWDNPASTTRCTAFWDEPTESAPYAIGALARRYLLGEGWNKIGFHDAELFQFEDNSTPRPATFCGVERGSHLGTAAYNQAWSAWLSALDAYLVEHGLAERGYYYVQNEPQNEADHALAAHLCRLTRAAAPHLRIAISEEPKPEIAQEAGGDCGYDIWIAHVRAYQEAYAWQRQRETSEVVWFYSLDHDPEPYFNPTQSSHQGMHERIIPWAAFRHRIRGWAYYDGGRFFDGSRPGARAELLREGFEDYEYLWLANGSAHPAVDVTSAVDPTVQSVAASMTSWTKNADAFMALRHRLGLYLGGETDELPTLQVESRRPYGAYYLNFQDPSGEPAAEPLVVDGKTYLKVGWAAYDANAGYGWSGENVADRSIALYGFDDVSGYSPLQQSYLYDDYGRDNLFEFDLAKGRYVVTVGVGRPARGYPSDPSNLTIEGQAVILDEVTTEASPVIERQVTLDITDGSLSMVVGGRSASTGEYSYTFLAYLRIEPAN